LELRQKRKISRATGKDYRGKTDFGIRSLLKSQRLTHTVLEKRINTTTYLVIVPSMEKQGDTHGRVHGAVSDWKSGSRGGELQRVASGIRSPLIYEMGVRFGRMRTSQNRDMGTQFCGVSLDVGHPARIRT
jgi:hypothetical protein